MSSPALREYVDGLTEPERAAAPALTALEAAILAVEPGFAVAVKYKILMYAVPGDWRHWVCAISTNRGGTALRFLYGVLLDDPLGVLRSGSATLMTWDFAPGDEVDATAVGGYVRNALDRHAYFKANSAQVAADAKAALADRKSRRG